MAKLPGESAGVGKVGGNGFDSSRSPISSNRKRGGMISPGQKKKPDDDKKKVGENVGVVRKPGDSGTKKAIAGGQAVGAAAGGGTVAYIIGKMGSFISGLIGAAVGAVVGFAQAALAFVMNIFTTIAGVIGSIGAALVMGGTTILTVIMIGALALTMLASDEQMRVGSLEDCATGVLAVDVDLTQQGDMNANAKKVYDALSAYGMNDIRIAGVLGNLQVESSIDPTCVEGFYGEENHYVMNEDKATAVADMNKYCTDTLFPLYNSNGTSYNANLYRVGDGSYACGGGMAQYTASGFYDLVKSAEATGQDWYSLNFAIAYLINGNHRGGAAFWDSWKEASEPVNPSEAAMYFARNYEGNETNAQTERKEYSNEWYARMATWSADGSYGNSILDLASTLSDVALDATVAEKLERCKKLMAYDNSSIASAAVSFAWPVQDQGRGNNGTDLYQRVHDNTMGKEDPYYMSCDRTICAAIRWSGSDDTFPPGNSDMQVDYMFVSPKWEHLGTSETLRVDQLLPGDVFGLYGHVFIYTGHELIAAKHGNAAADNADSVSGSYMDRSPGCGNDASDVIERMNGQDWIGRGVYHIFRCIDPDDSDKYKDAGAANASA